MSPRKKKRTLKVESDIHAKRRRQQTRTQTNVRGNLGNGEKILNFIIIERKINDFFFADSDSNDNSDINIFTRNQVEPSQGSSNKIQFNFLVELGKNLFK